MKTCTKQYDNFPFAHRAPKHDGHCRLVHGHNWSFVITFAAEEVDENGFVIDFGKLKGLRKELEAWFDHTFLLNASDPLLGTFKSFLGNLFLNNVRAVRDCSCEGIAEMVFHLAEAVVVEQSKGRVHVQRVVVYEDSKNSAAFEPALSALSKPPAPAT
jgi:6-pyruvoyltetrahydropterin/6-carboxytetrahydropterin synthase